MRRSRICRTRATPVEIVAGLDERGRPAAPFPIGVDEVGGLKDPDEGIPCAVHVADRDGSTRGGLAAEEGPCRERRRDHENGAGERSQRVPSVDEPWRIIPPSCIDVRHT